VEAYGKNGKNVHTKAPSIEDIILDHILPCVDVATAEQSLNQSKTVNTLVDLMRRTLSSLPIIDIHLFFLDT